MKTATQKALELVAAGATPYAAAKQCGIAQSTVHRAIARQSAACPACGRSPKKEQK